MNEFVNEENKILFKKIFGILPEFISSENVIQDDLIKNIVLNFIDEEKSDKFLGNILWLGFFESGFLAYNTENSKIYILNISGMFEFYCENKFLIAFENLRRKKSLDLNSDEICFLNNYVDFLIGKNILTNEDYIKNKKIITLEEGFYELFFKDELDETLNVKNEIDFRDRKKIENIILNKLMQGNINV